MSTLLPMLKGRTSIQRGNPTLFLIIIISVYLWINGAFFKRESGPARSTTEMYNRYCGDEYNRFATPTTLLRHK